MSSDFKVEKRQELTNKLASVLQEELGDEIIFSTDMYNSLSEVVEEALEQYIAPTEDEAEEPLEFYSNMDEFENTEEV